MPLFSATKTAQNVMDASSQDIRQVLSSSAAPDNAVLLDYVNRIQQYLLRYSKWPWDISPPQRFITQTGVTDYWIGPQGTGPSTAFDTNLNLSDVRTLKGVLDRTNQVALGKTDEPPLAAKLAYPDASSRLARPAEWRQDPDSPNIVNIYPAPDNQANYSPQPEPPICTAVSGGALSARVYWVSVTLVDSLGNESTAPPPTKIFLPTGTLLKVSPPFNAIWDGLPQGATGVKYDRYNVYAGQNPFNEPLVSQQLTLQSSLISNATAFTEPPSGLTTTGVTPPGNNSVEPIDGYIIEFRYNKQRPQVTSASTVLMIPDDYFDIVISGVNFLSFHYLHELQQAQIWEGIFREGVTSLIRDRNWFSKFGGADVIRPDAATIGGRLPAVESIDLSVLIS